VDPGLRPGRGFSLGELREAGLTPKEAMRLGLYVDKRRRSVHPWNVEALRKYLEKIKPSQSKQPSP
jgi:large subunit ribosomal protein L13e